MIIRKRDLTCYTVFLELFYVLEREKLQSVATFRKCIIAFVSHLKTNTFTGIYGEISRKNETRHLCEDSVDVRR